MPAGRYIVLVYALFFISNTFISNAWLKLTKKLSKCYATLWGWTFAIWKLFTFYIHVIIQKCVYIHEIMRLITMKMRMKMKSRSHIYDTNRPRPRHGHKYSKYKKCLSMMMLICIMQNLSNIWSSIYEKLSNTEAGLKKKPCS